jgi:hypothetical protein
MKPPDGSIACRTFGGVCDRGDGCLEVLPRLRAAERADVVGCTTVADDLRRRASFIASLCAYGSDW